MSFSEYIYRGFAFLFGLVTLAYFTWRDYFDDSKLPGTEAEQKKLLHGAQHKLWSLEDTNGLPGLRHNFLTLADGLKLHCVSNIRQTPARQLIVFVHGFPDSWHIYYRFLTSQALQASDAQLVAIDLPGYGGSDDLSHYGPDEVLTAVAEGIKQLKALYLGGNKPFCVLVGHDWGGFISLRIAAETKGLIDRLVAINIGHMPVIKYNARLAAKRCNDHLAAWSRNHLKFSNAAAAWRMLAPLRTQLLMSCYIFEFNLPLWLLKGIGLRSMKFILDNVHGVVHHRPANASSPDDSLAHLVAESRAASFGPSSAECPMHSDKTTTYGSSVLARSFTEYPGDWLQRVRLYRDGLSTGKWTLGAELQPYKPSAGSDWQNFECPVTVIFGLKDHALDPQIVLDGHERHFHGRAAISESSDSLKADASHIVRLKNCAHWSLLEDTGAQAVERTLLWSLREHSSSSGGLEEALQRVSANEVIVETYA
ncbi:hypothetical protein LTR15_003640 [Elasticomyces elasticus]|nr:hypothetical protein LTR15_003640 [Elasticomyces elasticus]